MNKYLKVIFLGFLIIGCYLIYGYYSNNINEYDLKESETLKEKLFGLKKLNLIGLTLNMTQMKNLLKSTQK